MSAALLHQRLGAGGDGGGRVWPRQATRSRRHRLASLFVKEQGAQFQRQPLPRQIGLIEDIDRDLHLLKRHQPYHESDHVLNIAYNLLAGGSRLEHLEVRRNDEVYWTSPRMAGAQIRA